MPELKTYINQPNNRLLYCGGFFEHLLVLNLFVVQDEIGMQAATNHVTELLHLKCSGLAVQKFHP